VRKTFAAFAVLGALAVAPAAFAADPQAVDPVAAELAFTAPSAQTADEEALVAGHRVADATEQTRSAGRMEGQDGWTTFAIGFFVVCAVFALAL
jgi:hypothetical protein